MLNRFKYKFESPQPCDILIFDEGNSSYIVDNIIEGGNYVVYNQRPEVLYISFRVIISLLINIKKFKWNLFESNIATKLIDYFRFTILQLINPKIIITYVDNSEKFGRLSQYYNTASFIAIQCGVRISSRRRKDKHFIHEHFICYGENDVELFNRWNHDVKYYHPVGSLKVGVVLNKLKNIPTPKINYDLCLVSIWRPMKYKLSSTYREDYADLWYTFDKMNDYINKFVNENGLRLCIAMRNEKNQFYEKLIDINEELYLEEKFGKNIKFFSFNPHTLNSYYAILESNIILGTASTLVLEALAMGKKIL